MLRIAYAVVLMLIATASPLRAAPCHAKVTGVGTAGASRNLARDINKLGFEAFSHADNASGVRDAIVSPLAIWYLDQFLDANWGNGQDVDATFLHQIGEHTNFSATVWANRSKSTYTVKDAAVAERVFCASTRWFPWATSQTVPRFINPSGYDFSVTLAFDVEFALPVAREGSVVRAPFFDDGSLHGIRLDSNDGATAAYLFWGTNDALTAFRASMNATEWESLTSRFKEANVLLGDISLQRFAYNESLPDDTRSFGTALFPGLLLPRALLSNESLTLSPKQSSVTVIAALHGYSTKPTRLNVNGRTEYQVEDYSVISDPGWTLPRAQRFSILKPLVYVIEDRSTTTILLMGAHE